MAAPSWGLVSASKEVEDASVGYLAAEVLLEGLSVSGAAGLSVVSLLQPMSAVAPNSPRVKIPVFISFSLSKFPVFMKPIAVARKIPCWQGRDVIGCTLCAG